MISLNYPGRSTTIRPAGAQLEFVGVKSPGRTSPLPSFKRRSVPMVLMGNWGFNGKAGEPEYHEHSGLKRRGSFRAP